jgi:hypothetical protein
LCRTIHPQLAGVAAAVQRPRRTASHGSRAHRQPPTNRPTNPTQLLTAAGPSLWRGRIASEQLPKGMDPGLGPQAPPPAASAAAAAPAANGARTAGEEGEESDEEEEEEEVEGSAPARAGSGRAAGASGGGGGGGQLGKRARGGGEAGADLSPPRRPRALSRSLDGKEEEEGGEMDDAAGAVARALVAASGVRRGGLQVRPRVPCVCACRVPRVVCMSVCVPRVGRLWRRSWSASERPTGSDGCGRQCPAADDTTRWPPYGPRYVPYRYVT